MQKLAEVGSVELCGTRVPWLPGAGSSCHLRVRSHSLREHHPSLQTDLFKLRD